MRIGDDELDARAGRAGQAAQEVGQKGLGLGGADRHADNFAPPVAVDADRDDYRSVLAGPWCMGFLAAMQLRYAAWAALRDLTRIEHGGLLLPILLHCTDHAGRPLLTPIRPDPEAQALLSNAYHAIPIVVPAIREFWMSSDIRKWVLPRVACWLIVKLRGTPWHGGARNLHGRTSSVSAS